MSALLSIFLIALGPLIVGFGDLSTSNEEEENLDVSETGSDTTTPIEETDDETVRSIEDFIFDRQEAARDLVGTGDAVNSGRGTDQDDLIEGVDTLANWFDASGGNDTLEGGILNDTLSGGADEDTLNGGDGDDVLFGGFQNETRMDDYAADVIDGGAGDDMLFFGVDDVVTGGEGDDVFVAVQDVSGENPLGNATIEDFDPEHDFLAVEAINPETATVTGQELTDAGLIISFSNAGSVTLLGVNEEMDEDAISFLPVSAIAA